MRASSVSGDTITTSDDNVVLDVVDRRYKLIKIVCRSGYKDALVLPSGCRNVTIDRLELETWSADGIKVQNAGTPAHHVTINGGFLRGYAIYDPSVHQDGIQTMGGHDLTFRNVAWDFVGGGGGCWFLAMGGSGVETPQRMTFEHCAVGPSHPNGIRVFSGSGHVLKDTLLYAPKSGRQPLSVSQSGQATVSGTVNRPTAPIDQAWKACLDYVGSGIQPAPEPGPGPAPEVPGECDDVEAALATANAQLLAARREAAQLNAAMAAANLREEQIDRLLVEAATTDVVLG
jgi:hypothetical protein